MRKRIEELRKEIGTVRLELREARDELAALRKELDDLKPELEKYQISEEERAGWEKASADAMSSIFSYRPISMKEASGVGK